MSKPIKISEEIEEWLLSRKRPGQTFNGVLVEIKQEINLKSE